MKDGGVAAWAHCHGNIGRHCSNSQVNTGEGEDQGLGPRWHCSDRNRIGGGTKLKRSRFSLRWRHIFYFHINCPIYRRRSDDNSACVRSVGSSWVKFKVQDFSCFAAHRTVGAWERNSVKRLCECMALYVFHMTKATIWQEKWRTAYGNRAATHSEVLFLGTQTNTKTTKHLKGKRLKCGRLFFF